MTNATVARCGPLGTVARLERAQDDLLDQLMESYTGADELIAHNTAGGPFPSLLAAPGLPRGDTA